MEDEKGIRTIRCSGGIGRPVSGMYRELREAFDLMIVGDVLRWDVDNSRSAAIQVWGWAKFNRWKVSVRQSAAVGRGQLTITLVKDDKRGE